MKYLAVKEHVNCMVDLGFHYFDNEETEEMIRVPSNILLNPESKQEEVLNCFNRYEKFF